MNVEFKDNSKEVLDAFHKQVALALSAIGQTAEGYAKEDCPVDTGRLRNSITFATKDNQGTPNDRDGTPAEPDDYQMRGEPEDKAIYIGTNVEYAPYVEYGDTTEHKSGKAHFLRDAVATHADEYRAIAKAALEK